MVTMLGLIKELGGMSVCLTHRRYISCSKYTTAVAAYISVSHDGRVLVTRFQTAWTT